MIAQKKDSMDSLGINLGEIVVLETSSGEVLFGSSIPSMPGLYMWCLSAEDAWKHLAAFHEDHGHDKFRATADSNNPQSTGREDAGT